MSGDVEQVAGARVFGDGARAIDLHPHAELSPRAGLVRLRELEARVVVDEAAEVAVVAGRGEERAAVLVHAGVGHALHGRRARVGRRRVIDLGRWGDEARIRVKSAHAPLGRHARDSFLPFVAQSRR
jgi:hypothetical protein